MACRFPSLQLGIFAALLLCRRSLACTSIVAGRGATAEGSALATHNNDCVQCDPRIVHVPARRHAPGSRRPIVGPGLAWPRYVGADRSPSYAAAPGQNDTPVTGWIPQVETTFAYWEANYPLLNEKGLGFGESTCPAKLMGQSVQDGGKALMGHAELMRVAAERCETARCAIQLMGDLAEQYGFYGEDPGPTGAGESLSVVDRKEAWIFHVSGGLHNTSATWVAQRVPDDHVAVVANNFIIGAVRCADTDNFLCGSGLLETARKAGLCEFTGEEDFHFTRCYGLDPRDTSYEAGRDPIPYYMTMRMWRVLSLANPSLPHAMTDDVFSYPFSVPVARLVSRTDVMNWMRDQFQGTEFDSRFGELAGPFNNPYRLEGGKGITTLQGNMQRAISIPRTSYGVLVEARPHKGRSLLWFATDSPATSVFVPFFARADRAALPYSTGRAEVFTRDSAWWAFNLVANWMNINHREMHARAVGPAVADSQKDVERKVRALEDAWPSDKETAALNELQVGVQEAVVHRWWALGERLFAEFSDGVYRTPETGADPEKIGYPLWYLQMIGYGKDSFRPQWVSWSPRVPPALLPLLPSALRLPADAAAAAWAASVPSAPPPGAIGGVLVGAVVAFGPAFALGRRRCTKAEDAAKDYVKMP